ncbi:MAG: hypothetical protein SCARUB_02830 [Candidatus Scalindua rubra]|uniref:Protein kinase domain-containing protein n=1 Tax=Candidatus Scalindua rubra TaxID=1872076 RepID=A0A1E3X8V5_9BACT|nr:MAG: hypothetical protein SCARUB_02830 [Candidatus Scalindua rubra]
MEEEAILPSEPEETEAEEKEIRTNFTQTVFFVETMHHGGMGKVYVARCKTDRKLYALKTILLEKRKTEEEREAFFKRFRWEGQIWAILGKHRNIVQAYWAEQDQFYRPLLIMEYVDGHSKYGVTLRDWIKKHNLEGKMLPISFILKIANEVLTALLYAKRIMKEELDMEFVHRDLKPENILITKKGVAKVTDFGLVKAFGEAGGDITLKVKEDEVERVTFMATKGICGTPPYMAPEQWRGEELEERTDVYALGCILYEMITGKTPFIRYSIEACRNAHLYETPKSPEMEEDDVPNALNILVLKCLSKDKKDRPKLSELRNELQRIYRELFGRKLEVKDTGDKLNVFDWHSRGICFSQLGLQGKAIICFNEALKIDPKKARIYHNRGDAYAFIGQYENAIKDYNRAIELNPNDPKFYNNLGIIFLDILNQHEKAIDNFTKAIELDPNFYSAYNNRGMAYNNLGQYDQAINNLEKVIELNPNLADSYLNLGNTYSYKDQNELAIEYYNKAIELNQQFALAYFNRGNSYRDIGQYELAIRDYDKAIELRPREVSTHFHGIESLPYLNRAKAYEILGEYRQAIENFNCFIEVASPQYAQDVEEAKKMIEELKGRAEKMF